MACGRERNELLVSLVAGYCQACTELAVNISEVSNCFTSILPLKNIVSLVEVHDGNKFSRGSQNEYWRKDSNVFWRLETNHGDNDHQNNEVQFQSLTTRKMSNRKQYNSTVHVIEKWYDDSYQT